MNDGNEVIAKIPCPNAGPPSLTTASEVATLKFRMCYVLTPMISVSLWLMLFFHSTVKDVYSSSGSSCLELRCCQRGRSRVYNHGKNSGGCLVGDMGGNE